jgi:hypothetical protein
MGIASTHQAETFSTHSLGPVVAVGQDVEPADAPAPQFRFDACPTWLELAVRHLSDAQVARDARIASWRGADDRSQSGTLLWEFEASMQATMACAITVDALYAVVQTRVPLPQSLIDQWRVKQTPRHVRIADVLGRAFALEPTNVGVVAQTLEEIFRFRDLAIDAPGKMDAKMLHPELGVEVESRFTYFRCDNALLIVKATVRLVTELVALADTPDAVLQKFIGALRSRLGPLQNANALRIQNQKSDTSPPWAP